jgi:hypothetical protein
MSNADCEHLPGLFTMDANGYLLNMVTMGTVINGSNMSSQILIFGN